MKKLLTPALVLFIGLAFVTLAAVWSPESNIPQPGDTVSRSLVKINSILYQAQAGTAPLATTGGGGGGDGTITTNLLVQLIATINAVSNEVVTLRAGVTNMVYGWPLYSVAAQYELGSVGAAVTNGAALAGVQTVVADIDTNTPFLLSATYICNTNCSSGSPQIMVYVFKSEPTALGANGALDFTYADWVNLCGVLTFTNRWLNAGTNMAQTVQASFAVSPTFYAVPVPESLAYTNLTGTPKDTVVFSLQQGK